MATFGKTEIGASGYYCSGNRKYGCLYELTEKAEVTELTVPSIRAHDVESLCILAIYAASGALVAISEELLIAPVTRASYTFQLPLPVVLLPGFYRLTWLSSTGVDVLYDATDVVDQLVYNGNSYAAGFSDPFGGFAVVGPRAVSIYATYTPIPIQYFAVSVDSSPTGIPFTVNGIERITPYTESLQEGAYTFTMPTQITVNSDVYNFVEWEDGWPNPVRTIDLAGEMSLIAYYELMPPPPPTHPLTVDSIPQGVPKRFITIEKMS